MVVFLLCPGEGPLPATADYLNERREQPNFDPIGRHASALGFIFYNHTSKDVEKRTPCETAGQAPFSIALHVVAFVKWPRSRTLTQEFSELSPSHELPRVSHRNHYVMFSGG